MASYRDDWRRAAEDIKWIVIAIVIVAILGFVAVSAGQQGATPAIGLAPIDSTLTTGAALPTACHLNGALPDSVCTPGAANPDVTQATITRTICVSGYSTRIRPPASYTDQLKVQQMRAYGLSGTTADYEEDHLIPLEVWALGSQPRNRS